MRQTNKMIMAEYKIEHGIAQDEPLLTYARWKHEGYKVKKGEKSNHRVMMWKYSEKTVEKDDGEKVRSGRCFLKTVCLFDRSQVEPLKDN